jgi:hypothetical protein
MDEFLKTNGVNTTFRDPLTVHGISRHFSPKMRLIRMASSRTGPFAAQGCTSHGAAAHDHVTWTARA